MDNWAAKNNFQFSIFNCQLLAKNVKHVLTHRILYADFWLWETEERPELPPDYFWIKDLEKLDPPPAPPCDGGE